MSHATRSSSAVANPNRATWRHAVRAIILVPVVGSVLALVGWSSWDWLVRGPTSTQQKIQSSLAVLIEWDDMQRGSPFRRQFHGVKLHDAETGSFLLSSGLIDWLELPDKNVVTLQAATVNRAQLHRILQLAHDRLCQQPWLLARDWQLTASDIHLSDPDLEPLDGNVVVHIETSDDAVTARMHVCSADGEVDRALIATLNRLKRDRQWVTEIDLDASQHPLPRSLLCMGRPWEGGLQSTSQFCGNCWIDVVDGIWETDIVGTIGPIDLAPLSRIALQETVQATAHVRIVQALWRNGELQKLDCFVTANAGTLTGRALEALGKSFGVQVSARVEQSGDWRDDEFEFDHMAFRVVANQHVVMVQPTMSDSRAIVSHRDQPLLEVPKPPRKGNVAVLDRLFAVSLPSLRFTLPWGGSDARYERPGRGE